VHYARAPRLFAELELAHGDGRFARLFRTLIKTDLLILDDWGPDRLTASQRRDLMEIIEDRYGDRHHLAVITLAAQPAKEGTFEQLSVEPIGLGAPVFARYGYARCVDDVGLDAACPEPARRPETVRMFKALSRFAPLARPHFENDRPQHFC
jgi:hypothetical protein